MKKRVNKVIILRVLVLVISLFICGLLYLNINYRRQISERDVLINKLMLKDSISSSVLKIQETDTTFIYKVHTDDVGNTLTYDQVDSMAMTYKRELDLKDLISIIFILQNNIHLFWRLFFHPFIFKFNNFFIFNK